MMIATHIWPVLLIWGLVYLADFAITIYSARLFQGPIGEHIRFEGSFELTPQFEKDVNAMRWISPNFLVRWLASFLLLYLVWWLAYRRLGFPQIFDFLMGGLFLREAVVLIRHMRNVAMVKLHETRPGLEGRITYARWLNLRLSAVDLALFGILFLILAAVLKNWFLLGGGVVCLFTGVQHWALARKEISRQAIRVLEDGVKDEG